MSSRTTGRLLGRLLGRSLVGGLCVAASLPPWGWWPLAIVGIALFFRVSDVALSRRHAFLAGAVFTVGWLTPAMAWMWFLSAPGYVIAVLIFAVLHGVAEAVVWRTEKRHVLQPLAHVLVEALRFSWPFGGAPLASLGISQSVSPLGSLARVGGVVLVSWVVWQLGTALAASRRTFVGLAGAAALLLLVAPTPGDDDAPVRARVAFVQGGGPQGTRAVNSDARDVHLRHLAATRTLSPDDRIDVVVWPENVVDVATFATSRELAEIAAEAERLDAPILVGVTEDAGRENFTNAQVVVTPDGGIVDRYDKVRRVPFGEYMPLRGVLDALGAPVHLVPRDAVAGTTPAVLRVPLDRPTISGDDVGSITVATAISWEVFFGGRVNEGVEEGADIVVNPTNGSSYRGTILQSQQIASSRLRAIESGRNVIQVAPTGFSAFVSPDGAVSARTGVSESAARYEDVALRSGRTWYSHLGDAPFIALGASVFAVLFWRHRPRARQKN